MPFFFLLFVFTPIIEIWVLIEVGSAIGAFSTVALVVLTAIIGTAMLRVQGLAVLSRLRAQMAARQLPATEIVEGAMLMVGGALLLTPGFVTDAIGFCCLVPASRTFIAKALAARFVARGFRRYTQPSHSQRGRQRPPPPSGDDNVLEGEYRRED